MSENGNGSRRGFLNNVISFFVFVSAIGVAFPLGSYLWPRKRVTSGSGTRSMKIPLSDIPIGDAKFVRFLNKPTVILRPNEQEVVALSAVCTHLGCVVKWKEDKKELFCPCHGGRFDIRGLVLGGPPPRPLPKYPVHTEDEYIVIEEA